LPSPCKIGTSIHQRPKEVKKTSYIWAPIPWQCEAPYSIAREWELDTVISSRRKSKGYLVTFIER